MTQKQQLVESKGLQAAVRLSKSDFTKIQQLVKAGLYRSSADFLREAVHDKLGGMEVVSVKKVEPKAAECRIEDFLKKHPGPNFASEIADALGLEFDVTFNIIHRLLEEGYIRKAKA